MPQTHFNHTYFVSGQTEFGQLNENLKMFWEVENFGMTTKYNTFKAEDQVALGKVEQTLKYENGRYEVSLPWKENGPELPLNNHDMALRHLEHETFAQEPGCSSIIFRMY